ncbi:LysR family transcriptional regulator [Paenibacillus sp. JNUCC32]|uniref:LysR family transcriptional regulator n=1 Tax=Paenibacillus sp. JNUCC32 TaxID=2777984 RepID=UPI001787FC70|nr:LysR family transcriptional regulator [Paenibacillus sp. JNUCC-32]QOT10910.1 LysR family transcriptional regulator [Paenibacillus sp. JNUCC-32]
MEMLQLKYFVTVARLEHMTKAAEELHIAQPALSKTISRLEENLGVPLFERQGRQIRLNPYGRAFLAKATAALQLLEEGRREVEDLAGLEHGRIHLALSNMEQLREPLRLFLREHPKVNFHIIQSSMEDMVQTIEHNEVDFFLTSMPVRHPDIRSLPLHVEEVFLAVPPTHRLAGNNRIRLSEAAGESFVGYKEGHPYQKMNNEFCKQAGFHPKVVCEVEDPGTIADLVRSGFGVALIGECRSSEELKLTKLSIQEPLARRVFQIAWLESRYLSKAAISFRDYLVEYYADHGKRDITTS